MDPIELYRRAGTSAAQMLDQVTPDQLTWDTPSPEWDVQDLIGHLTGSTEYLNTALASRAPVAPAHVRLLGAMGRRA